MSDYYFRLPNFNDLTKDQKLALNDSRPILVSGEAGTGKSVVMLWRHIRVNKVNAKGTILITFTKTLQYYLSQCAYKEDQRAGDLAEKHLHELLPLVSDDKTHLVPRIVFGTDEIILDETQDFKINEIQAIKERCLVLSYGADSNQTLYNKNFDENQMRNILPKNVRYVLSENFRNTYYNLRFIYAFIPELNLSYEVLEDLKEKNRLGEKPRIIINNNSNKLEIIKNIIKKYNNATENIAILVPFHRDLGTYVSLLQNAEFDFSYYSNKSGIENIKIKNIHITTFKSSKGLEFDYVIIPDIETVDEILSWSTVVAINDYYVGMTRAKTTLFLMSNKELNETRLKNMDSNFYDMIEI